MNTKEATVGAKYYDIVGGPNRDILFDACKYAYDDNVKLPVGFKIVIGYTTSPDNPGYTYMMMAATDFLISGIEQEDGSGEKFNLTGYCKADLDYSGGALNYKPYRFMAHYDSKKRKGFITFFEQ